MTKLGIKNVQSRFYLNFFFVDIGHVSKPKLFQLSDMVSGVIRISVFCIHT